MALIVCLVSYNLFICNATAATAKSLQSCPTLCDPLDGSPPGSPVSGILQARTLERVAVPFFRGSSHSRDGAQVSRTVQILYWLRHQGSPKYAEILQLAN